MASPPIGLLAATTVGISFCSAFIAGNCALTYIGLPALLLPPPASALPESSDAPLSGVVKPATNAPQLARQWQKIYNIGARAGPGDAAISAAAFLYAFQLLPSHATLPRRLYLAAAVLSTLVAPFTWTVMKKTNGELHRRANAATLGRDEEAGPKKDAREGTVESYPTADLIRWWGTLNIL